MRVCLVAGGGFPAPPPGYGSEAMVWELARTLGERGHQVDLIASGGSRAPLGGRVRYIRSSKGLVSFEGDDDAWQAHKADILAADVVHDMSHTQIVRERLHLEGSGPPALTTYNGIYFVHPRFGRGNAVVLSRAAKAKALAGESAWAGVGGRGAWDVPPGRLPDTTAVVPYGVDVDFYRPDGMEHARSDYLLYLGRPHPSKGVDLILELAAKLRGRRIILAWRPETPDHHVYDREYRRAAERLDNVTVLELPEVGHHEVKRQLLQQAAALVTPCRYTEAFGLTTIEALACGTPVIVGQNGAGPEIVDEGRAGAVGAVVDANAPDAVERLFVAVDRIGEFDRVACREMGVLRYNRLIMTTAYERLYARAAAGDRW